MKTLSVAVLSAVMMLGITTAEAKTTTTSSRNVSYTCQGGKRLYVTYGFNRQGLPTNAIAKVNGRSRVMPINLSRSDVVGTYFGSDNGYRIGTGAMTKANYRKQTIMLTSPSDEILFKECNAR